MKLSEIKEKVISIIEENYVHTLGDTIDPKFARFNHDNPKHWRRVSNALADKGVNLRRDWYDERTGKGKFRVGFIDGNIKRVYRYDRWGNESIEFHELSPSNKSVPDVK
jgi:hypothetical protein